MQLAAILQGILAAVATGLLWRSSARPLGFAMLVIWGASNAAQIMMPPEARDALNAGIDLASLLAFTILYLDHCPGRAAAVMLLFTALSLSVSVAHSWSANPVAGINAYELALNVIFIAECLWLITAGLFDVVGRWQNTVLSRAHNEWLRADEARRSQRVSEGEGQWKA